jgi:hypothetical protein
MMNFIKLLILIILLVPLQSCVPSFRISTPNNPQISKTETSLINSLKQDASRGDTKAVRGDQMALRATDQIETQASLRWLLVAGIVILALGSAVAYEFGIKLGGGVLALGGSLVFASMLITALLPYTFIIAMSLLGLLVVYLALRFYKPIIKKL